MALNDKYDVSPGRGFGVEIGVSGLKLKLQSVLFERYPMLFRRPGKRLISVLGAESCLRDDSGPIDYYGVECGNGWLPLIEGVSALCEAEIRSMPKRGVPKEDWPRCLQIKEKFGTLRFYVRGALSEATRVAIDAAVLESAKICEVCGEPAELRKDDAAQVTLCDSCVATRNESYCALDRTAWQRYISDLRGLLGARPE